jgi:hypothetical protein
MAGPEMKPRCVFLRIVLVSLVVALAQVRRLGGVFDFFQKNTLDTNLSGAIGGILFA